MSHHFPGTYAECDGSGTPVGEPFTISVLKHRAYGGADDSLYEVAQHRESELSWLYVSGNQVRARLAEGRWRRVDGDLVGAD